MRKGSPMRRFGNFLFTPFRYFGSLVPTLATTTFPMASRRRNPVTFSSVVRSDSLGASSVISALTSISLRVDDSILIDPCGAPRTATVPPAPKSSLSDFETIRLTVWPWAAAAKRHETTIVIRRLIFLVGIVLGGTGVAETILRPGDI